MALFDVEAWRQVLVGSFTQLGATLGSFVPKLVGMLLLLALGWLASRAVEAVARRLLHQIGIDRAGARLGLADALAPAGIAAPPSRIVARLVFWVLFLTFVLSAVETLGLQAVTETLDRLIAFLPGVIAALLLLLLGLLAGRLVRNVVSSAAAAADLAEAPRLGAMAQGGVVLLVVILALEQLGVETQILVSLLSVAAAVLGASMGLSFALGARPVMTHILAGHFLRQSLPRGGRVEIDGRGGVVERVGPVDTLLRDGERHWSIPNARLLEEVVTR